MKATNEEILEAVDGEMCPEQAEKLRIIREYMNGLDLCKANLQSLIFSTAEKYITEIDLVSTVPGMAAFSAIFVIGKIGVDMSVFPASKHLCALGRDLLRRTSKAQKRRKLLASVAPVFTSNLC